MELSYEVIRELREEREVEEVSVLVRGDRNPELEVIGVEAIGEAFCKGGELVLECGVYELPSEEETGGVGFEEEVGDILDKVILN